MSDLKKGEKHRNTSVSSSSSSVIEYVNEVFVASELDISGKIQVVDSSIDKTSAADLNGATPDRVKKGLVNLTEDPDEATECLGGRIRKMYVVALVVLLFPICMGMAATYSSTACEDMKKPERSLHPTEDQASWIASLVTVGALVGGSAAGYCTTVFGRKGTLILNTVPFVAGWIFVSQAKAIPVIYVGRIITGFCCGIVSVATPMYLVEIATSEVRGLLGAAFQLFVVVGVLLIAILGSHMTWRWAAISGATTSLLAAALMVPMPESPSWLMSQNRRGEAKNALKFLQGLSFDAEAECDRMQEEIQSQPKGGVDIRELKEPKALKPFLLSIALMFFQQFSGINAVLFFTVQIFKDAGSSMDANDATIAVAAVQVIATLVCNLLMDKAGRKPLLMISGSWMFVTLLIFGVYSYSAVKNPAMVHTYGWVPVVCMMSFVSAFSIGFGPAPWLMASEITPPRFRSIVGGVATALNWTFAFAVTKSYRTMIDILSNAGVYWFYSAICLASCFVTHFLLPETKGKSIKEIAYFFSH